MIRHFLIISFLVNSIIAANLSHAATNHLEFHTDAKLLQTSQGPVDKAYGYMNLVANHNGDGLISVMFSNGSQIDWARFNADVKFLNAAGSIIKQEHFTRRIKAATHNGAEEHRLVKPITISNFDPIEVDFYLSDLPAGEQ